MPEDKDLEKVMAEDEEHDLAISEIQSSTTSASRSVEEISVPQNSRSKFAAGEQSTGLSLTRTISALSRVPSTIPITPPPDGGTKAYLQIAGAFCINASAWGVINTWGVCQTYYATVLLPDYSESTLSWIGSLQVTLGFLVGIFSGRLADAGYFYPVVYLGIVLQAVGLFTASVSTEFWQLLLSQGICLGLGMGLSFTPVAALVSTYFDKKRALALATAASGTGVHGIILPVIIREMLPHTGYGWALRTVAFVALATNLLGMAMLRWRLPPRNTGPWLDYTAFSDKLFIIGLSGMFFVFWALYFAFFYIGGFASTQIGLPYTESINLLIVMVGVGVFARIIPGLLADRVAGPLNVMIPLIFYTAIMLFVWIAVHNVTGLYIFSAFYGFSGAAVQGVFPGLLSSFAPDVRYRGTRMGMGFFTVSWAVLSGPPIAGALLSANHGHYLYAQIWAGLSMLLGMSLLIVARVSKTGWVLKAKV